MASFQFETEAEWLSIRDAFVGGSEVAALFYRWRLPDGTESFHHLYETPPVDGVPVGSASPYKTPMRLWAEKSTLLIPEDISGERIMAGRHLESAMADWAREKWSWGIRKVRRYLTHDGVDGWGASLDYEVREKGKSGSPVEFKNVDKPIFDMEWSANKDEILAPPLHIILQVQAQIGVVGPKCEGGYIVACVGGNRLLRGFIPRHDAVQARIAEAVLAFWRGVYAGEKPGAVADYATVADCYAYAPQSAEPVDLTADPAFDALCREFLERATAAEEANTRLDNLKAALALKLEYASKARAAGYRVSWPIIHQEPRLVSYALDARQYRGALRVTPNRSPGAVSAATREINKTPPSF